MKQNQQVNFVRGLALFSYLIWTLDISWAKNKTKPQNQLKEQFTYLSQDDNNQDAFVLELENVSTDFQWSSSLVLPARLGFKQSFSALKNFGSACAQPEKLRSHSRSPH